MYGCCDGSPSPHRGQYVILATSSRACNRNRCLSCSTPDRHDVVFVVLPPFRSSRTWQAHDANGGGSFFEPPMFTQTMLETFTPHALVSSQALTTERSPARPARLLLITVVSVATFLAGCFVGAAAPVAIHHKSLSCSVQRCSVGDLPSRRQSMQSNGTRVLLYEDHRLPHRLHRPKYFTRSSVSLSSSSNLSRTHLLKLSIPCAFSYVVGHNDTIL